VSIITLKTATTKCLITSGETISQEELNGNMFPADFLEKYEVLDVLGKVYFFKFLNKF